MIYTKLKSALLLCGVFLLCSGSATADCAGKSDAVYQSNTRTEIGVNESNINTNNAAYPGLKGKTDLMSLSKMNVICGIDSNFSTANYIKGIKDRQMTWWNCYWGNPPSPGYPSYTNLCGT